MPKLSVEHYFFQDSTYLLMILSKTEAQSRDNVTKMAVTEIWEHC